MVRAELAARYPAGVRSHVLVATTGDGYALHCSDGGVATVVVAACEAASVDTRRNGTVVIVSPMVPGVASLRSSALPTTALLHSA